MARDLKNLWVAVVRKRACPLSVTLLQAQRKLQEAHWRYVELKPQATKLRCDWLRARLLDSSLPESSIKAAKRQLRAEEQRRTSLTIKHAMGKTRAGCISQVEVLEQGEYVLKTQQNEVENSIRANNEARFRLTEDTPTMQEPMKSVLGP